MSKLTRKPIESAPEDVFGRYQRFGLKENPFPPEPAINKDSIDKRINGGIYENEIRKNEYDHIKKVFIKQNLAQPNHLRLGYIVDTSYIGRGNGKSAFLVDLQRKINNEFCLDISEGLNKCFAIYVQPEPGGRTKTFASFVDALVLGIIKSNMIDVALASLRLESINSLFPDKTFELDDNSLIEMLNSPNWYAEQKIDYAEISDRIFENKMLRDIPSEFPVFWGKNSLIRPIVTQKNFLEHYSGELRRGQERLEFVFSHLVRLFQAASFNGSFMLVDDFERIPDWQSARQKRDFALELRTALYDGLSQNAKCGFYNFILVLHAGVQGLISDAWAESGMENRAPISPATTSNHIIKFEKLDKIYATLMIKKYLSEYRTPSAMAESISPFTEGAITQIGELSEYNAAKILKMCYDLLEMAADSNTENQIDGDFVAKNRAVLDEAANRSVPRIENIESIDLQEKIKKTEL
jgi:hypothetical protein